MKAITFGISPISPTSEPCSKTTVYDCSLLELPRIANRAGNITVLESNANCPFSIERAFYLYDVPGGACRGGHAHRQLQQIIIAASGSFDILLDDGRNRRTTFLNRPYYGLYIPAGIWAELHNFSSGSICLVLASEKYDEQDYFRDRQQYDSWKR